MAELPVPASARDGPGGLSSAEAAARLERDGPNEVSGLRRRPLLLFASKFWGISAWMLELIALLVVDAVISFFQEQRATAAADLRLVEGTLHLDQSALTGESQVVSVTAGNLVHSGASVRHGEATAGVIATGARTAFGRTVHLVDLARPTLQIERVVTRVVSWLFAIVGVLVLAVSLLAVWRGLPLAEIAPLALVLPTSTSYR